MKRTLVLIRHAKSDWGNPLLKDYDRPLNERGEKDAPVLGKRLKAKNLQPDLVISSTAKRAAQTAKAVVKGLGRDEKEIQWEDKMYHCRPATFEEVLFGTADRHKTVFMVAHNPGISAFAQQLIPSLPIDDMPTCAAVAIETDAERWEDLPLAKNTLSFIDTPKKPSENK